jgi:hypothetical protein
MSDSRSRRIPLAGLWGFALDPSDVGGAEKWFGRELTDRVKLPGTLAQTRLCAQGPNNEFGRPFLAAGDDYWTTARTLKDSAEHAARGSFSHADKPPGHIQQQRPSTLHDYRGALHDVPVPVIGHEVGQFQVFPVKEPPWWGFSMLLWRARG